MKDVTELCRKQLKLCRKDNIMSSLKQRNTMSRKVAAFMSTKYNLTGHKEVRKRTMKFRDCGNVWIENSDWNAKSLLGRIQILPSKTAKTPNTTALVTIPVHAILQNISTIKMRW